MDIYQLRNIVGREIVDFNQLVGILQDYAHPRGKISKWLSRGELIRVKKGLYVFGSAASREPYSIAHLANLIYGPSAISLSYALAFYGLIPEAVHTVTCITNKRNKQFTTPVGNFSYRYITTKKYAIGIQLLSSHDTNFLIATPEKALCDYIMLECKNIDFESFKDVDQFLFEDLRIDEAILSTFDMMLFKKITSIYNVGRLDNFLKYFHKE